MKLNDKVYNVLKWIVVLVLPSVATLLAALNSAWEWGLPIEAILATFSAVETFLGALIGISTASFNKESSENKEDTNNEQTN